MRLAKAAEMRGIDRKATDEYGIPSIVLMENAGMALLDALRSLLGITGSGYGSLRGTRTCILCGPGNNGGDGFVLARRVVDCGGRADVFAFCDPNALKGDALVNHAVMAKMVAYAGDALSIRYIVPDSGPCRDFSGALRLSVGLSGVVVDAVFGTGFKGDLPPAVRESFDTVRRTIGESSGPAKPILAADIPSGVDSDTGRTAPGALSADTTVTFALPKIGLCVYPGKSHAGRVVTACIGIPRPLLEDPDLATGMLTPVEAAGLIPSRRPTDHKGTFGRTVVVAGSPGMTGAAHLASMAAVRAGSGLVTLCVPDGLNAVLEAKTTEAMTLPCPATPGGCLSVRAMDRIAPQLQAGQGSLVIGPGLGRDQELPALIAGLAKGSPVPVLIDADGLNQLDVSVLAQRAPGSPDMVLTPHPGEMSRLTGLSVAEVESDRIGFAVRFAREWGVTLLLKGASTVIASPGGETWINPNGNPGMATGGTGDVLSGMIGGLMAQGMRGTMAAVLGAYIHGLAGDLAAVRGMASLAAGDLLGSLPAAMASLEGRAPHTM